MEQIRLLIDALGWRWCIPKESKEMDEDLMKFTMKNIPIFWVMGPKYCGKTATAEKLAKLTDYSLIKVSQLVKDEAAKGGYEGMVINEYIKSSGTVPDEIIINLLRRTILYASEDPEGYIIDGFPLNMRQAMFFVDHFCKPDIIIFVCLLLEGLIERLDTLSNINYQKIIVEHNKTMINLNQVYRRFERKTLKLLTNVPVDIICERLVDYLHANYGYDFPVFL